MVQLSRRIMAATGKEGVELMGYFEIIADWETCDKCEKPKAKIEGAFEYQDGLPILWFCGECK